jgi:hypothetical protein
MFIDRDDQWLSRMRGYGRNVPVSDLIGNADSALADCPLRERNAARAKLDRHKYFCIHGLRVFSRALAVKFLLTSIKTGSKILSLRLALRSDQS